ncbi:MAG: FG-GAP repeat domain-containing protein, partial [Cyclobacteriaceae bacterium]
PGALFIQKTDGKFSQSNLGLFERDRRAEDLDCIFFDADNDNDQDLYVARGGNEFIIPTEILIDQLYINDGLGNFTPSPQILPTFKFESSSCVQASDYDQDGDQDLFVGIRLRPGFYGTSTNGYILNNNGKGQFTNITSKVAPELLELGMITDMLWLDYDQDQDDDIVVVGEWMPISIFENNNGRFSLVSTPALSRSHGWWNCLKAGDFDKDGDMDLVAGNHGLNSRFAASKEKPISLYVKDFDQNGSPDPILSQFNGNQAYPMVLRHDLVVQLPMLKKKYLKYSSYKEQAVEDIFTEEQLSGTQIKKAYHLETSLLVNNGGGKFELQPLPTAAQFSPTYGILIEDFDRDGNLDILLGGNLYGVKPEVGRYDANHGIWLKGNGDNTFETFFPKTSGFYVPGEVRDMVSLKANRNSLILVAKNNDRMQVFEY